MKAIETVYIAGSYSSEDSIQMFKNIHDGIKFSVEVFDAGFIPFVPFLDFMFTLISPEVFVSKDQYYMYSMAWLKKSDALLIVNKSSWSNHKGVIKEIKTAYELGIPIFYSLRHLKDFRNYSDNDLQKIYNRFIGMFPSVALDIRMLK